MAAMAETSKTTSDKTGDVLFSASVIVNAKQDVGDAETRRFAVELAHHGDDPFTLALKMPGDIADLLERSGNYVLEVRRA